MAILSHVVKHIDFVHSLANECMSRCKTRLFCFTGAILARCLPELSCRLAGRKSTALTIALSLACSQVKCHGHSKSNGVPLHIRVPKNLNPRTLTPLVRGA